MNIKMVYIRSLALTILAVLAQTSAFAEDAPPVRSLQVELSGQEHNAIKTSWPGIGCWFWGAEDFQPDGYKTFLDDCQRYSPFQLLTTSIRYPAEVSDPKVHDQIKAAAEYARKHGMAIVMDLDVRLARSAFFAKYPEEMQEFVRLRDVALKDSGEASIAVEPISFSEHYTYAARPYETISARILKVYSYLNSPNGIAAVRDITRRCKVTETSEKGMLVTIPCKTEDRGRSACVVASFTVFTPDVFAPHLPDFERSILRQYADVPLGGACKDEWGFPARFGARTDEFFFSRPMADAYAKRRRGHNLTRDLLLMSKGEKGREPDRIAAINHYMEMNRLRNGELENSYYDGVKEVFGPTSMAATHPTWLAIPCADEAFKNGLDWWTVKKDLAQTDEQAPFCVRTSLAKKWQSPLWYNMIYARTMKSYEKSIWGYALAGGRMNIHAFYPWPEQGPEDLPGFLAKGQRDFLVAAQKLFRADCRIRLLNYISTAPLDCPVAVVFGHPRACNWASTGLGDCGLAVSDALWKDGYYADLIPSSEIGNKSLQLAEDGFIQYGPQKYAAVVLYEPQFERPEVAEFFRKAAAGKTSLFCVGDWTTDFEGREFNGDASLPSKMKRVDSSTAASQIIDVLKAKKIGPQTACESSPVEYAPTVMPKPDGQCRLLDGTRILVSATNDVLGDPIQKTIRIADQSVTFDSIGVAAVRLDKTGKLEAMAAGGLKSFEMDGMSIELQQRMDIALWRDEDGKLHGVLQDWDGPTPDALLAVTDDWTRLNVPRAGGLTAEVKGSNLAVGLHLEP